MLGSTYRLQLHGLGLVGATKIVPYLNELGIETLYLSPFLAATPGSSHGYDVIDPGRIDPAVGTDRDFQGLLDELADRGMHALLDVVPNHMAADPTNAWWWDVLVRGVASPHAVVFDIDWSRHGGRVLVPTLSRPLAEVLAEGGGALVDGVLSSTASRFPWPPGRPPGPLPRWSWRTSTSGPRTGGPPTRRAITGGSSTSDRWSACVSRTPTCSHARTSTSWSCVGIPPWPGCGWIMSTAWPTQGVPGEAAPSPPTGRLRQGRAGREDPCPRRGARSALAGGGHHGLRVRRPRHGPVPRAGRLSRLLELGSELTHTTDPTFTTLADQGKRRCLRSPSRAISIGSPGSHSARSMTRCQGTTWPSATYDGHGTSSPCIFGLPDVSGRRPPSACDRERVEPQGPRGPTAVRSCAAPWPRSRGRCSNGRSTRAPGCRWPALAAAQRGRHGQGRRGHGHLPLRRSAGAGRRRRRSGRRGDPVAALHRLVAARSGGLNATSTHDSKRNEDARCRLAVLSEADGEWASLVRNWHRLFTAPGEGAGPTEELTVYQALLALWPMSGDADRHTVDGSRTTW